MTRRRSGYVTIDVCEILNEVEDDVLLKECEARRLSPAKPGETCDLDIVQEAHDALMRGNPAEARVILDRLLFPKWHSVRSCEQNFTQSLLPKTPDRSEPKPPHAKP